MPIYNIFIQGKQIIGKELILSCCEQRTSDYINTSSSYTYKKFIFLSSKNMVYASPQQYVHINKNSNQFQVSFKSLANHESI